MRVKIKSLAAEAVIIRHEEKKAEIGGELAWKKPDCRESLHLHRVGVVRTEARASLLLYAHLRGVPYRSVEPNAKDSYERRVAINKALKMTKTFGGEAESFNEWISLSPVVD